MGGSGSGRWRWGNTRDTVESCRRIDIRDWQRRRLLSAGNLFSWYWWSQTGERKASIDVQVHHQQVILSYQVRIYGGEPAAIEEPVLLDKTRCHYGGERVWFCCPSCNQRVAILYLAGKCFKCRHCYDLAYTSQRESQMDRATTRAQLIRRKLGGNMNMSYPFPRKPKGMHWRTYWRWMRKEKQAQQMSLAGLSQLLEKLKGHSG